MITQQSLELDKKVKFDDDPDIQAMVKREAELIAEINTFDEALKSARAELVDLRKKLVPLKKKHGLHVPINKKIIEFIKNNPGCSYRQIEEAMINIGITAFSSNLNSKLGDNSIIVRDKLYYPGVKNKTGYGIISGIIFEYVHNVEWFTIRNLVEHVESEGYPNKTNVVNAFFTKSKNLSKFEVDTPTRYKRYRLKNEYRNKDLGV